MNKNLKGEDLSRQAEQDMADILFADINVSAKQLNTENDYKSFGKKIQGVLYKGQAPYRIPAFFKEVLTGLSGQLDSKKIKEILDNVTTLYNEKVKEEKDKDKPSKGKSAKAAIKSGKQTTNIVNNQMMSDMMGEQDYGDENEDDYGDEGDYQAKGTKKKVPEAEIDFM